MACQQFQLQIFEDMENQLCPADRPALAAHLSNCAECTAWIAELSRLDAALSRAVRAPALGSNFSALVQQRIQLEGLRLSEREREERKRELRNEFESRLGELRKGSFRFSLVDSLVCVAVAAWTGWMLSLAGPAWAQLLVDRLPTDLAGSLSLSLAASGVFVLVGLWAVYQRQLIQEWAGRR